MKSKLLLFFILLATVSFCQNDLQAEIQTLESEIKSLEKEISSLESQRDQELNAQQLLIDEKQKEENQQQQVVDQINDEIKDLNTKLSNYAVNQNQILAYKELSDKELYVERSLDKKLTKFKEAIKESNTILYSDYRMLYSINTLYILNNKGKSRFQKIEYSEKQQKQFNKLIEKEVLLPVGAVRASYLKAETGLDEQYFTLFDKKNNQDATLLKEKTKILKIEEEKDDLVSKKAEIKSKYSKLIDIELKKINNQKKAIDIVNQEILNIEREANKLKLTQGFNKNLKSCQIGSQTWMTKNLKVKYFQNGDSIMEANDSSDWYYALENNIPAFGVIDWSEWEVDEEPKNWQCGYYYNIHAIKDERNIAPSGWRLPNNEDLSVIDTYIKRNLDWDWKSLRAVKGWGYGVTDVKCKKCENWTEKYRTNRRGCSRCQDKLVEDRIRKFVNGNNLSGFNCYPCRFLSYLESSYRIFGGIDAKAVSLWDTWDVGYD